MILQVYLEVAFLEAKLFVQRAHPLDKVTPERARPVSLQASSTESTPFPPPRGRWGPNPHLCFSHSCGRCIIVDILVLKLK